MWTHCNEYAFMRRWRVSMICAPMAFSGSYRFLLRCGVIVCTRGIRDWHAIQMRQRNHMSANMIVSADDWVWLSCTQTPPTPRAPAQTLSQYHAPLHSHHAPSSMYLSTISLWRRNTYMQSCPFNATNAYSEVSFACRFASINGHQKYQKKYAQSNTTLNARWMTGFLSEL